MEHGELAPAGVSRRLLDGLARLLGVAQDELEGAGDLGGWQTPPAAAASAIQFRAAPSAAEAIREDLEVLADALMPPTDGEDWDEIDELFRGGR